MSLYFLEHDLYVGISWGNQGFLIITSHDHRSHQWHDHCYLWYEISEAIYLHVKNYHDIELSMEEIETELEETA